jgi:hypothetical protein
MQPRFPIYIPSKSRAARATTPRYLDKINVPYRLVIEEQQYEEYNDYFPAKKLIILDKSYQENYDTCDDLGGEFSRGSGPARNFIWEHSIAEGHDWHWIMDDNISRFFRFYQNVKTPIGDGWIFHAMEEFCLRYENVVMAGPQYSTFVPAREKRQPYTAATRIFSCNLIRNDIPYRWRARYNEDVDLSIRILKGGYQTILFNAFLQEKLRTQRMPGGNTEAFYADKGTLPKSEMLVRLHPDIAKVVWRYGRWHHAVDFSQFKDRALIRKKDLVIPKENPYKLKTVDREG